MKLNVALSLVCMLGSVSLYAGDKAGNGTDDVLLAYSEEDAKKAKQALNLDYLKMSKKDISKRARKLKPIYNAYKSLTIGKLGRFISSEFGAYVFDADRDTKSMRNKKDVMYQAVYYYLGWDRSTFYGADSSVLTGYSSVDYSSGNVDQKMTTFSFTSECFPDEYRSDQVDFLLHKYDYEDTYWDYSRHEDGIEKECSATYHSYDTELFKAPSLLNFVEAMDQTKLKAIDATIVFLAGNLYGNNNFEVIYPSYHRLTPIPQPIIFIDRKASKRDLVEMLKEHAPRIYTYNKMFDQELLPQIDDLNYYLGVYGTEPNNKKRQAMISAVLDENFGKAREKQSFQSLDSIAESEDSGIYRFTLGSQLKTILAEEQQD